MKFLDDLKIFYEKNNWRVSLLIIFFFFASIILAYDALSELVERWIAQEEYSHGFLIPLVSLYIIWEKRFQIYNSYNGGSRWGILVVALSLFLILVGEFSEIHLISRYAFILLLYGLSLTVLGTASRYTIIPILLLVFSIPLPYFLEVVLTARLQLWSSELGVMFIKMMGIPVYLSGNVIDLGAYKLQVVEACSGLSYLFPLTCLGFIAAYFYQAPLWRKAVLFLSTIPITILMNSFRIGVTGWLVNGWGISHAEGFLHDFEGWIIFVACAALLGLEIEILERLTSGKGVIDVFGLDISETSYHFKSEKVFSNLIPLFLITMMAYGFAFTGQLLEKQLEQVTVKANLHLFPSIMNDWYGSEGALDTHVIETLQLTDYLMMNFEKENEPLVNFYVAFYESQRGGIAPHSPRVCIPGGGWEIADIRRENIDNIPVNRVVIRRGLDSQLVYYWFQERGVPVANEYLKKWYTLRDALRYNRTDGSLVRVVTPIVSNESIEEADERLKRFIRLSYEELTNVLPSKGAL